MSKKPRKAKAPEFTVSKATAELRFAVQEKADLVRREREDFRFALGEQWSPDDTANLKKSGLKPSTDNRIAPNLFLLTGLERQNRSEFKAFPIGEEDGLKAEIATALFKDAIKRSGYSYKSSDQFKDGITCGEAHLELYLDYTEDLVNGRPCWRKCDGGSLFPDPSSREYDLSDARFVYKVTAEVEREDLINLYPEQEKAIRAVARGKGRLTPDLGGEEHEQGRDYPVEPTEQPGGEAPEQDTLDLVERFYKKWVPRFFVGDMDTGQLVEADGEEEAQAFVEEYRAGIAMDARMYEDAVRGKLAEHMVAVPGDMPEELRLADLASNGALPPAPPQRNPDRFKVLKRQVPEIWVFAWVPGMDEPLADERAWCYPRWKSFPFVTYFARFSTAPLTGKDRHLLVQGVVHGVKGVQEKHNKAEMLMLRHLNSSANSGWLSAQGSWVDESKVEQFGTTPGVNLEYKADKPKPERITPTPLSQGHAQLSVNYAEAIKAQLGINSDLLASQQGSGGDSGRAIALRQRQGLLMVQELFDNLTRSRVVAGRMLLSQLGEMYDTTVAMKVLGEKWLERAFPPLMLMDPETGEERPAMDPRTSQPMRFDRERAEVEIAAVLKGDLERYDVAVGEAVASETVRMANSAELKELAAAIPGLVQPDTLIRSSQLPESIKMELLASFEQMKAAQQRAAELAAKVPQAKPKQGAPKGAEEA